MVPLDTATLRSLFEHLHADEDGLIAKSDWLTAASTEAFITTVRHTRTLWPLLWINRWRQRFEDLRCTHKSRISWPEVREFVFSLHYERQSNNEQDEALMDLFYVCDTDADGKISCLDWVRAARDGSVVRMIETFPGLRNHMCRVAAWRQTFLDRSMAGKGHFDFREFSEFVRRCLLPQSDDGDRMDSSHDIHNNRRGNDNYTTKNNSGWQSSKHGRENGNDGRGNRSASINSLRRGLFESVDKNKDRTWDQFELLAHMRGSPQIQETARTHPKLRDLLHPDRFDVTFSAMDRDGDGRVSWTDLQAFLMEDSQLSSPAKEEEEEEETKEIDLLEREAQDAAAEALAAYQQASKLIQNQ